MYHFDLKDAEFVCERELVTTKNCDFCLGNTNDSIVFAQRGGEIAVCALIDFIGSGFGHRMAAMDDTRS